MPRIVKSHCRRNPLRYFSLAIILNFWKHCRRGRCFGYRQWQVVVFAVRIHHNNMFISTVVSWLKPGLGELYPTFFLPSPTQLRIDFLHFSFLLLAPSRHTLKSINLLAIIVFNPFLIGSRFSIWILLKHLVRVFVWPQRIQNVILIATNQIYRLT